MKKKEAITTARDCVTCEVSAYHLIICPSIKPPTTKITILIIYRFISPLFTLLTHNITYLIDLFHKMPIGNFNDFFLDFMRLFNFEIRRKLSSTNIFYL